MSLASGLVMKNGPIKHWLNGNTIVDVTIDSELRRASAPRRSLRLLHLGKDSPESGGLEKLTFQQESHFPHLAAEIDTFDRFDRGDQGVIVIHIFQLVDQPAVIHLTLTNLDVELFLLGVAKTNLIDIFHEVREAAVGIGTTNVMTRIQA